MSDVATVEAPPSLQALAAMTPTERYNVAAKAHGAPTVERPASKPQFQTDATVTELSRRDGMKLEPWKPETQPAAKPLVQAPANDPSKVAAFDREMQAKGLQVQPRAADGRFTADPQEGYKAALTKLYRETPEAQRTTEWKLRWQQEFADAQDGRRQGESRVEFLNRTAGSKPTVQDGVPGQQPAAPAQEFSPEQWEEGHKSVTDEAGWIPLERVNPKALSGYTLPKLIDGQVVNSAAFTMLADARKAGITQTQVDSYFREQMKRDGWI